MAFPHEHILLRFNGHFGTSGGPLDRWSCGIRFGLPASAPAYDAAKLQTFVDAAKTAATTFHSTAGTNAGTNCFLTTVTGAQIGVLGKYSPPGQLTIVSNSTAVAGLGSPTFPWNTASVFSLRTANPRGRASNGRVYWPALALVVDGTTGRVAAGNLASRLGNYKTFMDSLNTAANTYSAGMKAIVASAVGGGLIAYVTAVRADGRMDSIERRENDQASVYSSVTLA